ncbi:hypothetical protein GCM10027612_65510 [Microbispora bryophytorum subsp. camponoti]
MLDSGSREMASRTVYRMMPRRGGGTRMPFGPLPAVAACAADFSGPAAATAATAAMPVVAARNRRRLSPSLRPR